MTMVIGTESEYGNSGLNADAFIGGVSDPDFAGAYPGVYNRHETVGNGFYAFNASRLYKDSHYGLEYATPECGSPREAVLYELAGPFLVDELFRALLARDILDDRLQLLVKNNNPPCRPDSDWPFPVFSYGNHLNFRLPVHSYQAELGIVNSYARNLASFAHQTAALVATLPLVCGAGLILKARGLARLGGGDYSYLISARSHYSGAVLSSNSTAMHDKPLFLHRDESFDDPTHWRLQIIGLDANILPLPNLIKLTALQLAVELWSRGELEPVLLNDPVGTMRDTSADWHISHRTEGGETLSAVEIQYRYLRQMLAYVKRNQRYEMLPALREWGYQLSCFRQNATVPEELFGHNDWVTKYLLINRRKVDFEQAQRIHLAYHSFKLGTDFERCTPVKLTRRFGGASLIESIRRAARQAPTSTRALARQKFIRAVRFCDDATVGITWSALRVGPKTIQMPDPTQPIWPAVDDFVDSHSYAYKAA